MSITLKKDNSEETITGDLVGTEFKTVDGTIIEVIKNDNDSYTNLSDSSVWTVKPEVTEGGKKRRSSKKSKKGGNKHTMTMGGKKSKKSKKGGKRSSKKSRKH